jgi:hypothetical protein
MSRRLIVVLVVALGALFVVPSANAAFGVEEWEAVTCKENEDLPAAPGAFPLAEAPNQCNKNTPTKWFTQAAGHPNFGITEFVLNNTAGFPDGFVKKIVVDTPEGLSVNPEALPQCPLAVAEVSPAGCPANTIVGTNYLTVVVAAGPTLARAAVPVYNIEPFQGVPSMVGFPESTGAPVFIVGSLDPADQHVRFTIDPVHAPEPPSHPPIVGSRLVFNGVAGNGTYLTMPSNCGPGQTSKLFVESYEALSAQAAFTTAVGASGCDLVPFKPTIGVAAGGAVDSPEEATIDVGIPFDPSAPIANSYLKSAKIVLPQGAGLNPSVANGLVACSDAQFAKGTNNPIACPDASKIGTVEVETPALPAKSLTGTVYVGQPLSSDPASGELFRIFIHVGSDRYGVNVRLVGNVFPNLTTGQLTAVVNDNPQATFSNFKVRIGGGPRGALTSPPTCGPNTTTTEMTPWSGNPDQNKPSSSFTMTTDPTGGACPATLAARKFTPGYTAKSDNTTGGAYSPFRVHIGRRDGEQELKVVDVTLPPGLTGKLAGIPYCSDAALAAAAVTRGTVEQASSNCPSASQIGSVSTLAGTGGLPLKLGGKAYLAGPYKGAPLSFAVITPAVAGPYDLGTLVIRVPLFVNPTTAQIRADSDVIPDVFGGVKTDIRSIDINIDRSQFMRNPTNCDPKAIAGTINGGGSNPAVPAAFSAYPVSVAYQATNCNQLGFKPKLKLRLYGKKASKRRGHPRIEATLTAREGDANDARTAVTLPAGTLLDNAHIKTICTRVQLAAGQCPKAAQYGNATATSPLLDNPLKGPVYLVSSSDKLPNLLADLRGQVNVQLRGVITTVKGRMKTTFPEVPDVPVRKFTLKMRGGSKGLLINSKDLCKSKKSRQAKLSMKAQNGKKLTNNKLKIQVSCKKKKKK